MESIESFSLICPRKKRVSFPGSFPWTSLRAFCLPYPWFIRIPLDTSCLPYKTVKFLGPLSLYLAQVLEYCWPLIDYWMVMYVLVTNTSTIKMGKHFSETHLIITRSLEISFDSKWTSAVVLKLDTTFPKVVFQLYFSFIYFFMNIFILNE